MLRSKLFWKLFVMYAALTVVSLISLTLFHLSNRARLLQNQHDRRLHDITRLLQTVLQANWSDADRTAQEKQLALLGQQTDVRLFVVDPQGVILAASERSFLAGTDQLSADEISATVKKPGGLGERAGIGGKKLRYCLMPLQDGESTVAYVGAGEPTTDNDSEQLLHRRISLGLVFMVMSIALTGTYIAVRQVWRPLAVLTEAANQVALGRDVAPIDVERGSELLPLAMAFDRMNRQIRNRERELRDAANLLSTVLGGMAEGVLAVDSSRTLLFANAASGRLLKFDPESAKGKQIQDVVRHDVLRTVVRESLQVPTEDTKIPTEMQLEGTSGRVLALNAARLPGRPCPGLVIVLHDISERRGLEEMRQQFIANVSHELKTPLSSIKVHAETLLAGAVDDASVNRRFLAEIEEQAERLHQLILDMLQLARIESGRQGLEIVAIDVAEVVESSLHLHHNAVQKKAIQIEARGAAENICVMADHEGIQQIVDNLIDNAIKYSPDGSLVQIRWRSEQNVVVIEVQDHGPGIRPEDQERVFERFFRVDKARSRELGSTGLGLSIVKHLARALGGSVTLQSEFGVGSTFSIRLPKADVLTSKAK